MCLDASTGLHSGSEIKLWECHGGERQQFLVGENDFSNFNEGRYIRIHSRDTPNPYNGVGHTLVSVGKRNFNNKQCWSTNTFSYWPNKDWEAQNVNGKTNNIMTGTNLHIDRNEDWNESINLSQGFIARDLNISKHRYDELKYMNGYFIWEEQGQYAKYKNLWNGSAPGYDFFIRNCSTYSRDLWAEYTWEVIDMPAIHNPGVVYNAIQWHWFNGSNNGLTCYE